MLSKSRVSLSALILSFFLSTHSHATPMPKEWCDVFATETMLSMSANRMFGHITYLNDTEYAARKKWFKHSITIAKDRFKKLTGQDFNKFQDSTDGEWLNWVPQCQLKDIAS